MRTRHVFLELLSPALVRTRREPSIRTTVPVRRTPCPEAVSTTSLVARLR
jgi:hypothetical protein